MSALPTTNITTTMVRNILEENNNAVTQLCTSTKINKWAKYKPVNDLRVEVPLIDLGRSSDNNYGIITPSFGSLDQILSNAEMWSYARPTTSMPKRLGDFRGYLHDAKIPFRLEIPTLLIIGGEARISIRLLNDENHANNVNLSDIFNSNYSFLYFGVCVEWGRGTQKTRAYRTSPDSLSAHLRTTIILNSAAAPFNNVILENCLIYPFLSTTLIQNWTTTLPPTTLINLYVENTELAYPVESQSGDNEDWGNAEYSFYMSRIPLSGEVIVGRDVLHQRTESLVFKLGNSTPQQVHTMRYNYRSAYNYNSPIILGNSKLFIDEGCTIPYTQNAFYTTLYFKYDRMWDGVGGIQQTSPPTFGGSTDLILRDSANRIVAAYSLSIDY